MMPWNIGVVNRQPGVSQDNLMLGRVNNVKADGFLMQKTNIERESCCLMSDPFANGWVVDSSDSDRWGA